MRLSQSTTALKSRRKRTHGSPLPFGPAPDSNASIAALTTSLHCIALQARHVTISWSTVAQCEMIIRLDPTSDVPVADQALAQNEQE
jgi:hypothetical protein